MRWGQEAPAQLPISISLSAFALLDNHFCVFCQVRRLPKMEGIISSTRILIAAAFGPVLLAGKCFHWVGWVGIDFSCQGFAGSSPSAKY